MFELRRAREAINHIAKKGLSKDSLNDLLEFIKKQKSRIDGKNYEIHIIKDLCKDISNAFKHYSRLHDVPGFRNLRMNFRNLVTLTSEFAHDPRECVKNRGTPSDIVANIQTLLSGIENPLNRLKEQYA